MCSFKIRSFILLCFFLSLKIFGQSATKLNSIALDFFMKKDYANALQYYFLSIEKDSNDTEVLHQIAKCSFYTYDLINAQVYYRKLFRHDVHKKYQEDLSIMACLLKCQGIIRGRRRNLRRF